MNLRARFRRVGAAVALAALLGSVAACDPQTATSPTGDLELIAHFGDVQDLVRGHTVQIANVVVGSVREVSLDGYEARVRMSIVDDRPIPDGTRAVLRRTSLLGEFYVDLVFPEGYTGGGPYLASGSEIEDTETERDIEQLAEQAAVVVGSIAGDDIAGVVSAGAEALGGRGPTINHAVDDAAAVLDVLAAQQEQLGAAVDGVAALGSALAPHSADIGELLDQLGAATTQVASSRDRVIDAVEALVGLATATNDIILTPHTDALVRFIDRFDPMVAAVAADTGTLANLIVDFRRFTQILPTAVVNGQVLLLAWAYLDPSTLGLGEVDPLDPLGGLLGELLGTNP